MAVVLLTDDLVTASRVEGAAQRAGIAVATAADAAGVLAHGEVQPIDLVVIDLSAKWGDPVTVVRRFAATAGDRPPILAFGPHVHEARLEAAAAAGCDRVLSRGEFFAGLETMFERLGRDHP